MAKCACGCDLDVEGSSRREYREGHRQRAHNRRVREQGRSFWAGLSGIQRRPREEVDGERRVRPYA